MRAPGVVDRVVARLLGRRIAAGELDGAALAAGLRSRHGRLADAAQAKAKSVNRGRRVSSQ